MIWASCRGQLLARTVTGIMRNKKVRQKCSAGWAPRVLGGLNGGAGGTDAGLRLAKGVPTPAAASWPAQALEVVANLEHPKPHTMSALEHQKYIHKLVRLQGGGGEAAGARM